MSGPAWRLQRRARKIAMTPRERDDFLATERTARVATASPDGRPHVSPLWYAWDGQAMWLYSLTRSQRWTDLQRNPRCSVVVDAGTDYLELRGVELAGTVEVVGEVPRLGAPAPAALERAELLFAERYHGGGPLALDGRHAWLRLRPEREYTWDFRKL